MTAGLASRHRTHALVVIDVQRGFDDASWGRRDNPDCEHNVHRLLNAWRTADQPIVVVRHDSAEPHSPLRPGTPGNDLKPGVAGPRDVLIVKSGHSAFHGTPDLHRWCQRRGIDTLTLCGITADHCCDTTARFAAALGYRTRLCLDATHTFDRIDADGQVVTAEVLRQAVGASLLGEFAEVLTTAEAVRRMSSPTGRRGRAGQPAMRSPIR